jgi:5-methylcytosine-specific restriction endonuclease McrA
VSSPYISETVKTRVRDAAKNRCGYCQSQQQYVMGILEIEHILPTAIGGDNNEQNLWLSCRLCNSYKGIQTKGNDPISDRSVQLFNQRTQRWSKHFTWSEEGVYILGLTPSGRVQFWPYSSTIFML